MRTSLTTVVLFVLVCVSTASAQMVMPPHDLCSGTPNATIVAAGATLTTPDNAVYACLGVHGTVVLGAKTTVRTLHLYGDGTLRMHGGELIVADVAPTDEDQFTTGLVLEGRIEIDGGGGRLAWTRLAEPLKAGSKVLTVGLTPSNWMVGDDLLFPDTRNLTPEDNAAKRYWAPESQKICAISGQTITLCAPLAIDHPDQWSRDRVVHVLPMVGNLTRAAKIRSANRSGNRGHIMITRGATGFIRNTRIESMGRTTIAPLGPANVKGRYALHIHMAETPGLEVSDDVIVDSLKWGITVHGTNGHRIARNVVWGALGAGIMTEDGSEVDNVFDQNLIVQVIGEGDRFYGGPNSDIGRNGSGIWLQGAGNPVTRNVVANSIFGYAPYGSGANNALAAFADNEAVAVSNGFNPWDIWGGGNVERLIVWHSMKYGAFPGSSANLTYTDLVVLFDPASHFDGDGRTGFSPGDYEAFNSVLVRPRVENAQIGIQPSMGAAAGDPSNHQDRITVVQDGIVCNNKYGVYLETVNTSTQLRAARITVVRGLRSCAGDVAYAKWFTVEGKGNLIDPLRIVVLDDQGVPGQNFEVFNGWQSPGMIVPQSNEAGLIGSPDAGLTNAQNWAKHHIAIMGAVSPCATPRANVYGYACEILGALPALPEPTPSKVTGGLAPPAEPAAAPDPSEPPSLVAGSLDACVDPIAAGCYEVEVIARLAADVSSVTATPDGRLMLIENGARVRIASHDVLLSDPALMLDRPSSRLEQIVLDRQFGTTGLVFVSEIETKPDGSHEFSIVRYREVQNTLGEAASVVSGLRLPAGGKAPFTVDSAGMLYVAIPAGALGSTAPYAGMILRFLSDGRSVSTSPGFSPVLAQGFAVPTALEWDQTRNELWISGADSQAQSSIARVPLMTQSADWPLRLIFEFPTSASRSLRIGALNLASPESGGNGLLLLNSSPPPLLRVRPDTKAETAVSLHGHGDPVSVAIGTRDTIYAVTRSVNPSDGSFELLRLRRR